MLIRTSRWPFLPLAIIFAAPGLLFPSLAFVAVMRGWEFPTIGALLVVAAAFFALWLNMVLPILRPRTLTFSTEGLRFRGLWIDRHWTWDQFDRASGGIKVTLHLRSQRPARDQQLFIGPFWPGGSDEIMELANHWRS
jgi:hypothetical protein